MIGAATVSSLLLKINYKQTLGGSYRLKVVGMAKGYNEEPLLRFFIRQQNAVFTEDRMYLRKTIVFIRLL